MTKTATSTRRRIPMTKFHNAMGEFLDEAMRTPIVLTKHGRDKQIVADHAYVERLEAIAQGNIIKALQLEVHSIRDMPAEMKERILATQPTPEEIATGCWNDA
jgi:prevent-host-death family protein